MGLKLNGIAFAFLCTHPPYIDIVCTSLQIDEENRLTKIIDEENTYKQTIDANDESAFYKASERAARAILAVHDRQKRTLKDAGLPYRPFVMKDGIHSRHTYPGQVENINRTFFTPADPRWKFFTTGLTSIFSKNASTRQEFEAAMRACYLALGGYVPGKPHADLSAEEIREGTTSEYIEINRGIRRLKPYFDNPETKESALKSLVELGKKLGRQMVPEPQKGFMHIEMTKPQWLNLINPVASNYLTNPTAQEVAPIYDFARWSPLIRQAIMDGFTEQHKKHYSKWPLSNVLFSCITDRSRPFADVIHAMVLDQIDVARGRMSEDQISHHNHGVFAKKIADFASETYIPS